MDGIKLIFCRIRYTFRKCRRDPFYFYYLSYGSRIGAKVQDKVHTKLQIIF